MMKKQHRTMNAVSTGRQEKEEERWVEDGSWRSFL
jgi:hypothetical protein